MKTIILILVGSLILAAPAFAGTDELIQQPSTTTLVDNPLQKTFSLLDPSRLKINHGYSFSYISAGGNSGSVGLYMSTIQYQISRPLTLRVGLQYVHSPLKMFGGDTGGFVTQGLYPSFYLDWQPSSKFHLGIGYQKVPGGYGYAYPTSSWWRSR